VYIVSSGGDNRTVKDRLRELVIGWICQPKRQQQRHGVSIGIGYDGFTLENLTAIDCNRLSVGIISPHYTC